MRFILGTGLLVSAVVMTACSGDDERAAPLSWQGAGGTGNRPGSGGGSNEGGAAGDGAEPQDPRAPVVVVISPDAVENPDDGVVLTAGEVDVTCSATRSAATGSQPVDPAALRVQLVDEEGNVIQEVAGEPSDGDEFTGTLNVPADLPNGPVTLRCLASDTSEPPRQGRGSVGTFVDQGPTIVVNEPAPDSGHPLEGVVSVEFEVLPAPLAGGDDGAEVGEVSLDVNGVPIALSNDGDVYSADIDFTDAVLFPEAPTGSVPFLLRASNSRAPEPITRTHGYSITVDGAGPVIDVTSHNSDDVVGGEVVLQFTVADELSGVDRSTVVVELNGVPNEFVPGDPWSEANGNYSFTFDSRNIQTSTVQITVNVRATDNVGNESDGASLTLWLDNTPPTVDLDPANVREWKVVASNEVCSESFDPVGPAAVNDEEVIGKIETFRTLVWEGTNSLPGQTTLHHAGTNVDSVYMYLSDENEPLLIDTNEDDVCDEIAVDDLDFLQLAGINPTGSAWFGNASPAAYPDPAPFGCSLESAPNEPAHLCTLNASDMTRVIKHDYMSTIPALFAKPEFVGTECTGQQWELGPFIDTEGWVCLAARAEDVVGNVGISRPLRACYDDPTTEEQPDCATMTTTPPDCTDGCTPPPRLALGFVRN